jgi:hypothetical protein
MEALPSHLPPHKGKKPDIGENLLPFAAWLFAAKRRWRVREVATQSARSTPDSRRSRANTLWLLIGRCRHLVTLAWASGMRRKAAIDHIKGSKGILRNADGMMITSTTARTTYAIHRPLVA